MVSILKYRGITRHRTSKVSTDDWMNRFELPSWISALIHTVNFLQSNFNYRFPNVTGSFGLHKPDEHRTSNAIPVSKGIEGIMGATPAAPLIVPVARILPLVMGVTRAIAIGDRNERRHFYASPKLRTYDSPTLLLLPPVIRKPHHLAIPPSGVARRRRRHPPSRRHCTTHDARHTTDTRRDARRPPTHLLVEDLVDVQRLDDVGDKLRVDVGVADLLVQQLAHRARRLRADLLGLVADVEQRRLGCGHTGVMASRVIASGVIALRVMASGVMHQGL